MSADDAAERAARAPSRQLLRSLRAALNGEQARVKFIREAAIGHYEHGAWEANECWRRARMLWDCKPEDC